MTPSLSSMQHGIVTCLALPRRMATIRSTNVTRNALSVLTLAGLDTPVAKGCADPIAGVRIHAGNGHGKTGAGRHDPAGARSDPD